MARCGRVVVIATIVGFASSVSAVASAPRSASLGEYMAQIESLGEHWRQAADLVDAGKLPEALVLLESASASPGAVRYAREHEQLQQRLRSFIRGYKDLSELAKWYLVAESPERAAKAFEAAGEVAPLRWAYANDYIQSLVETGEFRRAAELLRPRLERQPSDYDREKLEARITLLEQAARRKAADMEFFRDYYLEYWPVSYHPRFGPVLALWRLQVPSDKVGDKFFLLADLFKKSGDYGARQLALEAIPELPEATPEQAAVALLQLGSARYGSRDTDGAIGFWQRVADDYRHTASWGKAVFNIGLALKKQCRYQEAIREFETLLGSDVNDLEPGGHVMEMYRNYRPRAQWEIGNCLFALGDYAGALAAYRTTEHEFPFRSGCGNAQAEFEYRYAFYQGLCLEYLGRHDEAVRSYLRAARDLHFYSNATVHIRLVDLYEAAGQTEGLKRLARRLPSKVILRVFEIRQLEKARDWPSLVALLHIKGTVAGPEERYARLGNWEGTEAARLLAEHPEAAVPLLADTLTGEPSADDKWVYYALGLCGTGEAVAILKEKAEQEEYWYPAASLVYALGLAGEFGEAALDSLAETAHFNVTLAVQRYRDHQLGDADGDVQFPSIPANLALPKEPRAVPGSGFSLSRNPAGNQ